MQKVVGVRLEDNGKIYYFNPKNFQLKLNDSVIVQTEHGLAFGKIALNISNISEEELQEPLKEVVRIASKKDLVIALREE